MNIEEPILTSMLDDDLYKINMGSVVFHLFPKAIATYEFINRGHTQFPPGFDYALRRQIGLMENLKLTSAEAEWLKKIPYIRPTYIEWLAGYKLNSSEVSVIQMNGELVIKIRGPWYRTIFWEVKLMAVISELYFKMTGQLKTDDWCQRVADKAKKLSNAGCYWIDFGTRRRFSHEVQDFVVDEMNGWDGFMGTSNPHLAHKYNVVPHGTYAHESIMAMSALYGARMANKMWMKHWAEHFDGNVGVALTDTFTTEKFLQDFGTYEGRLFDGCRQDSGDPQKWGIKMLNHYKQLGISSINKRFVFSDNLNDDKYIALDKHFRQWAQPIGGIGTFFTNDVFSDQQKANGCRPLNMVIKMTSADFGNGPVDVVKLSDDPGKHTGNSEAIELVKRELGI